MALTIPAIRRVEGGAMTSLRENRPTVSVIVPVYNVEKYLARCLDSLLAQDTNVDYEVICINDCSPDGSLRILEDYQQRFPGRIHVLENKENIGLGATRDHGVREAAGNYLMFIDSDDYVKSDYIERYMDAMKASPCDIVIGGYIDTDGTKESPRLLPHSPWTELCFSAAWAKMYRRTFVEEHGLKFTAIRYAEDTLFNLNAFALDARCTIIDYAGYCYFANPSSITRENRHDKRLERELSALYRSFVASDAFERLSQDRRQMVEYSYVADMLSTILLFSRRCGRQLMLEKYAFFKDDLETIFPNYRRNPYLTLRGPIGQRTSIRRGVSAFMMADKLHLSKQLFTLFGVL